MPGFSGRYFETINGSDGDAVRVMAWNSTHYGNTTVVLLGDVDDVNVSLNLSRSPEVNVSILAPANNTAYNVGTFFNATANISAVGAEATGCNATISFGDALVLNVSNLDSLNHSIGSIPFGQAVATSWNVSAQGAINTTLTVTAKCENEAVNLESPSWATASNITVIDSQGPLVSLMSPANNTLSEINTVVFNYTVSDPSRISNFTLSINNILNVSNSTAVLKDAVQNMTQSLESGQYNWTVRCQDIAGNVGNGTNFNLTVDTTSDLTLNSTDILFINITPLEDQNVTINATIRNIGSRDSAQFVVEFFEGFLEQNRLIMNTTVPGLTAGSSLIVNTTYLPKPGPNNIYVRLDWNNSVDEENETNNQANNTLHVDGYSYYFGNSSTSILLGTAGNTTIYSWLFPNSTGNLFAADADSSLDFTALQALGRKTSGDISSADFQEADTLFNMTNFTDSLQNLYTTDSVAPRKTKNFTIFGTPLANVSVTNSTNSTDFETGILWDTSKDSSSNSEYDQTDKEPLVFITDVALPKSGRYGYYSYEIRAPARLRMYAQPNNQNSLAFYAELN